MFKLRQLFVLPLFLVALVAIPVTGCAAFWSALPTIVAAVSDTTLVLDQIANFVGTYFRQHPSAELQAKFDAAISDTRSALIIAERVASAAKDIGDADVQAAFAKFSDAYTALMDLVSQFGVKRASAVFPSSKLAPGTMVVPEPAILKLRSAQ